MMKGKCKCTSKLPADAWGLKAPSPAPPMHMANLSGIVAYVFVVDAIVVAWLCVFIAA